jgi:hypothetical protein
MEQNPKMVDRVRVLLNGIDWIQNECSARLQFFRDQYPCMSMEAVRPIRERRMRAIVLLRLEVLILQL